MASSLRYTSGLFKLPWFTPKLSCSYRGLKFHHTQYRRWSITASDDLIPKVPDFAFAFEYALKPTLDFTTYFLKALMASLYEAPGLSLARQGP